MNKWLATPANTPTNAPMPAPLHEIPAIVFAPGYSSEMSLEDATTTGWLGTDGMPSDDGSAVIATMDEHP